MKKRMFVVIAILVLLILSVIAVLIYNGMIQLNRPSAEDYPVRGVDVSHFQGKIDWHKLQAQGIMFAFIKATEGSAYTDGMFHTNWENAALTDIRPGAYHFFSFGSPGLMQAKNFIDTVPVIGDMLPPVIDIEPYGEYKTYKDVAALVPEIRDWLNAVEDAYGMKPVIYTTEAFYKGFIATGFPDHDVWIRSVYKPPSGSVRWTFWQYSDRTRMDGYEGEERFIDMNAFHGSVESFRSYGR